MLNYIEITRMENSFTRFIDKAIRYCYYAIFFLVPIVMHPHTFELFEFNKMWITFGFTLVIMFLWIAKILATKKFVFQRTILDIPLALFALSQILSTIFSMDPHTSFWGYYSRFNGGLLSLFSYIFLYYGFATHLVTHDLPLFQNKSFRLIGVSLISGALVALWGFPSHFGADPTCLVFRGSLDVSCWTDSFQPTVRIFSTLGQPNWMAAYLAVLLPISLAYLIPFIARKKASIVQIASGSIILALLLYIDILFTRSQSGFLAVWMGLILFAGIVGYSFRKQKKSENIKTEKFVVKALLITGVLFLLFTFFMGTPVSFLQKFTLEGIRSTSQPAKIETKTTTKTTQTPDAGGELGGSDSARIRLIVWRGAFEIFKQHPLFGSGVETFAFAYYKVKPVEHNLTSEWDFLYNKAHNEYLNYLATTGILGLGTYLLFIGWFLYTSLKYLLSTILTNHAQENHNSLIVNHKSYLVAALTGGFVSILVSNFFGFSVVIINLFLFVIPILVYDIAGFGLSKQFVWNFGSEKSTKEELGLDGIQTLGIIIIGIVFLYLELVLYQYWIADQKYSLGYNLNKFAGVQGYIDAQKPLTEAVDIRPSENLYKNELSVNLATLALVAKEQNQATQAARLAEQAAKLSDEVVAENPNNVVYFKTRTRVYYAISQFNPTYFAEAIRSIEKSQELAPTDAKILYNEALLYGQEGNREKAIDILGQTIKLKHNYTDAYYARALMYNQQAGEVAKTDTVKAQELKEKARQDLKFILEKLDPNNKPVQELLKSIT